MESTVPAAGTFSSLFLCEIEAGESARPILLAQMELELRATFAGIAKKIIGFLMFFEEAMGSRRGSPSRHRVVGSNVVCRF